MPIMEVVVAPLGTESPSVSSYVADCQKVLARTEGIQYQLTPMGTIVEGELDLLLQVIKELHQVPFARNARRVMTLVRIDDRRDKTLTMEGKLASVREKL